QHDTHGAAADEEKRIAGVAAREDGLSRLIGARFHAAGKRRDGLLGTRLEELDLMEIEWQLVHALERAFLQDVIFHPLERLIAMTEGAHATLAADQAHLVEIVLEMLSGRNIERQVTEDKEAAALAQDVLDVLEHVGGGNVHGLD